VVIQETSIFTRQIQALMTDDEYAAVQQMLVDDPKSGDLISGTGGLRKVRVALQGRGKRGGGRIIYYHLSRDAQLRMLLVYKKGVKDDLTPAEKKELKSLNEHW
jgi:hypothetical protein